MSTFTDLARKFPEPTLGRGATPAQMKAAAKQLGVTFPNSFRNFLSQLGYFESAELTVYGAGNGVPYHLNLVKMVQVERDTWSDFVPMADELVPISPDGRGGHYCLDTARMRDGECPVVYWDHELVEPGYRPELAARSFETFFRRYVPRKPRRIRELTFDKAIDVLKRRAKKSGIVGDDLWKRGATPQQVAAAERALQIKFPADYRRILLEVDGFEHAGGWNIFGVGPELGSDQQLLPPAQRLWKRKPGLRHLLPIAKSWSGDLCCLDLNAHPLQVVALHAARLTQRRDAAPLDFPTYLIRISDKLDPWDEES